MAFAQSTDLFEGLTAEEKQVVALERATDMIRAATGGQQITRASSTVSLPGTGRRLMQLPQVPVASVESLTVRGQPLTQDLHYILSAEDGVLTRLGGHWPRGWPVVVAYTHGYDPVPDELMRLCAALADKILDGTAVGPVQSESESIGTYRRQVTYGSAGSSLFGAEGEQILDRYRLPALP